MNGRDTDVKRSSFIIASFIISPPGSTILRISIEERLVYRGDFALGTLMRFLPIVTQIFLWQAIFSAIAVSRQRRHVDSPATPTTTSSPITC